MDEASLCRFVGVGVSMTGSVYRGNFDGVNGGRGYLPVYFSSVS